MDDITWLNARTTVLAPAAGADEVRAFLTSASTAGAHTAVVHPTQEFLVPDNMRSAVAVGHPSGKHHGLIKASEARLAVEHGVEEIWLTPDPDLRDANAYLAEIATVRQAVPEPVVLVVRAVAPEVYEAAYLGGAEHVVTREEPARAADIAAVAGVDDAVVALEAGAQRLATRVAGWDRLK
ncbi:2-deoxyribose-5-phosphate aldolase [Corynebacterium yudongzhengii]|uniref:2-deoxyribose-5-phosphate aldolase n=1 Tax=Corynebacterium yudongzhengii TaxID=2080740 RepID=A0A2U1T4R4_9CORY|nr:2-deoxyribose-5-phosphate aldolase [Corynebacterium yudongzhengii]AWB81136.1 2-deoxyribose-5-phosphate aldolase [Corynebacterium yudongzhengii]PWC00994.1 2-deoxyribose-5-phosphate aldolase [Corynebacterium yudongzhengii]